ncbi:MAG: hypothetical protein V4819_05160 [Verrucomicrobiota bacterium]
MNAPLSLDTDFNGLGGQGTTLTAAFQEFDAPFPTGVSVQIRVVMHTNATNEYICIDNVRIFGDSPVTAPPVLAGVPGAALVFTEGGADAALAPAITVTDTDSANLASATVTISSGLTTTEDVLAATPSGAIVAGDIVYNSALGKLTITRSAPLATYQTVLRSVTYQNTNVTAPSTATRNITFGANDGVNASNSPIRQVTVVDNIATQNLPFTETFETDGRGTRYAIDGRFTNGAAMFDRGTPAGVTNLDGTFAIIAEDTLLDAAPTKAVAFLLNTAPFGTVSASVRLGALGGAIYDTGDVIAIEASVNGAAFTTVAAFRSTGGSVHPDGTRHKQRRHRRRHAAFHGDAGFFLCHARRDHSRAARPLPEQHDRRASHRGPHLGDRQCPADREHARSRCHRQRRRGEWQCELAELFHRHRGPCSRSDLHRANQH